MSRWGVLIPVALAILLGACAGTRGVRLLARGLRHSDPDSPLCVIRGLIVFGAIWLAEEVYETGVLALILRAEAKDT